ncbi:hypothetical protein RDABS01_031544 [Bienertia sinuspersici]
MQFGSSFWSTGCGSFYSGGALGPVNIAYSGRVGYIYNRNGNECFVVQKCGIPSHHHLSGLFGVSSLAWTGHLVHVAIPEPEENICITTSSRIRSLFIGQWNLYAQNPDSSSHLFGTSQGAGNAILTLLGDFIHKRKNELWIGHSMKDLLEAHIPPGGRLGRGHKVFMTQSIIRFIFN